MRLLQHSAESLVPPGSHHKLGVHGGDLVGSPFSNPPADPVERLLVGDVVDRNPEDA